MVGNNVLTQIRLDWLEQWEPYLASFEPDGVGDWKAHCPIHEDHNPSASVNFDKGEWYCYACKQGGDLGALSDMLLERIDNDFIPNWVEGQKAEHSTGGNGKLPTEKHIEMWHRDLMQDGDALEYLYMRGLTNETIIKYKLITRYAPPNINYYGFPIYDSSGRLVNVRYYMPQTSDNNKQVWGVQGHNTPRLYPIDIAMKSKTVYIVEGEFDALMLISKGLPAITSTGASGKWMKYWNKLFKNKTVIIIPDHDNPGIKYAYEIKDHLDAVAQEAVVVHLPFEITKDHGQDISDYIIRYEHTLEDLSRLIARARRESMHNDLMRDERLPEILGSIRLREKAVEIARRQNIELSWIPPDTTMTVKDEMRVPMIPFEFTVDGLHPSGGNTLITSGYKVGKSTILLNLMRALIDGKKFLGKFDTIKPEGNVAFWNYEISRNQFKTWLQAINIKNKQKASVMTLRGTPFPLDVDYIYEWAEEWLSTRGVEILIIDPFSRAFAGDENDNTQVGDWLDILDHLKSDVGISDLFLSAHFGRNHEERARGATRIEDWPDAIWTLVRDGNTRYFSAIGRDVDLEESRLEFDEFSKSLSLVGGSRKQEKILAITDAIIIAVSQNKDGIPVTELKNTLTKMGSASEIQEALNNGENDGKFRIDRSRRPFTAHPASGS